MLSAAYVLFLRWACPGYRPELTMSLRASTASSLRGLGTGRKLLQVWSPMLGSDFAASQGPLGVRMRVGMVALGSEQVFSSSISRVSNSNAKSGSATMVTCSTLLYGAGMCRCCLEILVKELGVCSGSCPVRTCSCVVYSQLRQGMKGLCDGREPSPTPPTCPLDLLSCLALSTYWLPCCSMACNCLFMVPAQSSLL